MVHGESKNDLWGISERLLFSGVLSDMRSNNSRVESSTRPPNSLKRSGELKTLRHIAPSLLVCVGLIGCGPDEEPSNNNSTPNNTTNNTSANNTAQGNNTTPANNTASNNTSACAPGTQGCMCGEGEVCDGALVCTDGICTMDTSCAPGEEDCACGENETCGDGLACIQGTCVTQEMAPPCMENEHVQEGVCVACAPGSTNPAGDDPSGADTECMASMCAENEFVENHSCAPCAPGSINPAGDLTTSEDTTCEAIACGADEYVENNACAMCPGETTNDAGDLANGADTLCDDDCTGAVGVYCEDFEVAFIKASNPNIGDLFGSTAELSGDTLVVGAWGEGSSATGVGGNQLDESASRSGAVYVFRNTNGVWAQEAYIKASNTGENDGFGRVLALDGDTLVVGAFSESSNATGVDGNQADDSLTRAGAAYVFRRSGTTWTQEAYLKASNTDLNDVFGSAIDVLGDTIAIGAPGESSNATGVDGNQANNSKAVSGAVYTFTRSNGVWTQEAYIKASNTEGQTSFGTAVALEGDRLAVGSPRERSDSTGIDAEQNLDGSSNGAVYVFARTNGVWEEKTFIKASNTDFGDRFGSTLAWSGDLLAVSAPQEDSNAAGVGGDQMDNSIENAGAVYLFRETNGVWEQEAFVKASNPGEGDLFGTKLTVWGDYLVASSLNESSNATGLNGDQTNDAIDYSGATYIFKRSGDVWAQIAYLKAPTSSASMFFGSALSMDEGLLAIGAYGERSDATGVNGTINGNNLGQSGAVFLRRLVP